MKKVILLLTGLLLMTAFASAQSNITVSGKVTDQGGAPLPGASVYAKGTTNGTISDFEGKYSLTVPSDATLVVTFVGYVSQEIAVSGKSDISVSMEEDNKQIDEIVVVGYGTQKKADITGSVAIVNTDDMKKQSNSNMSTMLAGKVAGVSVTTSGEPGADPTVRVRGLSSFGDLSPLYVIDGVPVGTSIRDFSPSDIESMQVLKDASAAAIYGARAANGVIIITTKHGKKNQPLKIDFKGSVGFDYVDRSVVEMCNAKEYQYMANQAMINDGLGIWQANNVNSQYYIGDVDTDWEDVMLTTGVRQNYNINLSGGGDNSTYNASFDYYDSDGTMEGIGPSYTRYTFRVNNTMKVKFIDLQTNVTYSHSDQNSLHVAAGGGSNDAMILQIFNTVPTMSVYNDGRNALNTTEYGTYDATRTGETYSRNLLAVNNLIDSKVNVDRILASGSAQVNFDDLFKFNKNHKLYYKVNLSWDKTYAKDYYWLPKYYMAQFSVSELGSLNEGYRNYGSGLVENTLNYDLTMGKHHVNLLGGVSFQRDTYHTLTGYGEGYESNDYQEINLAETTKSTSYDSEHTIASQFGRINYDFDDKYLLQATVRRDGSSRFSPDNRWGVFPSVAAGWKINKEEFFPVDENIISELKLRASFGELGNESIGDYVYMETINTNYVYSFNGTKVLGAGVYTVPNQDLKWETKKMLNYGIDASFLKGALNVTAEYYESTSSDILLAMIIPYTVGSSSNSVTMNCGELKNSGFEFNVTYRNKIGQVNYEVGVNGATLKNEVKDLAVSSEDGIISGNTITNVGSEIGRWYGWKFEGLFQQEDVDNGLIPSSADDYTTGMYAFQEATTGAGDAIYFDKDENGVINAEDREDLGSAIPKFTYGISLACDWKGIDFSMFLRGSSKFLAYNSLGESVRHTAGITNWSVEMLDAWTPTNTDTDIPKVSYGNATTYNSSFSDRLLQDATYLKIANLEVGYTFPDSMVGRVLENLRVFASIQNVYTFSKYDGYNVDFAGSVWTPGYDNCSYPTPRTFLFGVNLTFK